MQADSKDQLRLKIATLRAKETPRYQVDAQKVTLGAFLEEWLDTVVKADNRRATYVLREATCRNHIIPHIGTIKLGDLEKAHVRGLLATLQDRKVGIRTQFIAHATLRAALNVAVDDEVLERNVAILKRKRNTERGEDLPERMFLDAVQAYQLLRAARGDEFEALYILALHTGCRQGELFALEWKDVLFDRSVLHVTATLTEDAKGNLVRTEPKTKQSRRGVFLGKIALGALREHKRKTGDFAGFVFHDGSGGPLRKSNFLRRHFHPLVQRAGLPHITFHSLRHTASSILSEKNVTDAVLAGRHGHSIRMVKDTYSHAFTDAQRAAAEVVDTIFGT